MLLFLEGITLRQTRSESYASVLDEINNPPRIWGAGEACTVGVESAKFGVNGLVGGGQGRLDFGLIGLIGRIHGSARPGRHLDE
jgi:hypothetical protein